MAIAIEITDFLTQVMNIAPEADTELVAAHIRYQQIKAAVMDYSKDRPRVVAVDIAGDGGKYYAINATNLPNWADGFSHVRRIEYPAAAVASDETPVYLRATDYDPSFFDGTTHYIYFSGVTPATGQNIRIEHTAYYTWAAGTTTTGSVNQTAHGFSLNDFVYETATAGTWSKAAGDDNTGLLLATHVVTTVTDVDNFTATALAVEIPPIDFFAVCHLAACHICQAIAERFSRTSESLITGDSVNHTSRAQEFANRAREFCKLYKEHIGQLTGQEAPAQGPHSAPVALDLRPRTYGQRHYLFRGRP